MTPTTADLRALLDGICACPKNVFRRLVYADALEDAGGCGERAEFIRVQCAIDDMKTEYDPQSPLPDNHPVHARWLDLRRRERELLDANGLKWSDPVMETGLAPACFRSDWQSFGYGSSGWQFRRGFVEAVSCYCKAWLEHGPQIVRAQPIRKVTLPDWSIAFEPDPIRWARGPHPVLGLEALPLLEEK